MFVCNVGLLAGVLFRMPDSGSQSMWVVLWLLMYGAAWVATGPAEDGFMVWRMTRWDKPRRKNSRSDSGRIRLDIKERKELVGLLIGRLANWRWVKWRKTKVSKSIFVDIKCFID